MKQCHITLLVGLILLVGGFPSMTKAADGPTTKTEDIWDDEPRQGRSPHWYRWLSDENVERILKGLQKRDPAKAKELGELRKKDPERFKAELGKHGRPEIEEISRERYQAWKQRKQADFIKWLKANYAQEERDLTKLKEKDPQLYVKSYEHLLAKYGRIFEADRSNPELGAVLKEDLELKARRDELVRRLRYEKSQAKRQTLGVELQEVVARRYDLIVRRKKIAYERLQRKLEDLQKQIKDSKDEIIRWQDNETRLQNVRRRIESLTEGKMRFKWD